MKPSDFISRWMNRSGGQERANYALFLAELCDVLEVPRPDPASVESETNDYVFERVVKEVRRDGTVSSQRIDLYRRNSFVLEAKQSRLKGEAKEVEGQGLLFEPAPGELGRRSASKAWDVLMTNARTQAENYVRHLPAHHAPPPFVIVCDVGHCFEIYANFRRDGKAYDQFPDRQGFRIYLEDLADPATRERLRSIWLDPDSLDPAKNSARVTREIAERLAKVSKSLEAKYRPDQVAMFLMRCLFTMFAEDVELLPKESFKQVLLACEKKPDTFVPVVEQLWQAMDKGGFAHALLGKVRHFNGEFFANPEVLPLTAEAICELRLAATANWREVEPAIFGTLVEQALDPAERKKLGAHYTPRAYVERLVHATILDPLRAEWSSVLASVELDKTKDSAKAIQRVQAYHEKLRTLRILDPACGTGNFLYVALELLKRLEGEVLETLASLGGQEGFAGLSDIDPKQFLGLELNPRAAAIAELVLWIGYLQWFYRNLKGHPGEPILKAYHNILVRDAVLTPDRKKRPEWPEADYIIGNPPFIGGSLIRARLGEDYAQALWKAHRPMNESADFVMYWWDRAAELLTRKGTRLKRFGLVTTNSISQMFQRRVMERHLNAKKPVSLIMAIADHPWTKATKDSAAVRIAMTVAEAGKHEGRLYTVELEEALDSDNPALMLSMCDGRINSDLTVGVDVVSAGKLNANSGIAHDGVKLHGSGFIVNPAHANTLGLGTLPGLEEHIRPYRNGRDIAQRSRDVMVIDLFGLTADEVRDRFPAVYQHVLAEVKPERDANNRASYKENWWIFGEPRKDLRPALANLPRYIVTVDTAKHRVFQWLDAAIICDDKLVIVASDDAFHLGVLSSRLHGVWALRAGGWLGMGNDPVYVKSRCFDPFPFPDCTEAQKATIRAIAEQLDAHHKSVLGKHHHLTLTGLYNVLERVKAGALKPDLFTPAPRTLADLDARKSAPAAEVPPLTAEERRIFDDGLVLILKEYHDSLDAAVAESYGWPADLSEEDILARLVALNAQRAKEESRGDVKWLRPDYQIPRFGSEKEKAAQIEAELVGGTSGSAPLLGPRPAFPDGPLEQIIAVTAALAVAQVPQTAEMLAQAFRKGPQVRTRIDEALKAIARTGQANREAGGYVLRRAA